MVVLAGLWLAARWTMPSLTMVVDTAINVFTTFKGYATTIYLELASLAIYLTAATTLTQSSRPSTLVVSSLNKIGVTHATAVTDVSQYFREYTSTLGPIITILGFYALAIGLILAASQKIRIGTSRGPSTFYISVFLLTEMYGGVLRVPGILWPIVYIAGAVALYWIIAVIRDRMSSFAGSVHTEIASSNIGIVFIEMFQPIIVLPGTLFAVFVGGKSLKSLSTKS